MGCGASVPHGAGPPTGSGGKARKGGPRVPFPQRPCYFDRLPNDLVLEVLQYLSAVDISRMSRVCVRFNMVSYDVSLRTKWDMPSVMTSRVMDSTLSRIARFSAGLLSVVDLAGCRRVTEAGLNTIFAAGAAALEEVNLTGCANVTPAALEFMAEQCHGLLRARLALASSVTDDMCESLKRVAKGCPLLEELDIYGWRIDNTSLSALASGCPKLRSLSFSCFYNTMDKVVNDEGMSDFCEIATALRSLHISHSQFLTADSYSTLLAIPELEDLSLMHCDILDVNAPPYGCRALRSLTLSHVRVKDPEIITMAAAATNLRSLRLRFCTYLSDAFLERVCQLCLNLRVLDLFGCPISDTGVKLIGAAVSHLDLQILNLSHTNITDYAAVALLEFGACIGVVDIADCPKVHPQAIIKFYQRRHRQRHQGLSTHGSLELEAFNRTTVLNPKEELPEMVATSR